MSETAAQLRARRTKAIKAGKKLYAHLAGRSAEVVALTDCAPRYGTVAFRTVRGEGWYPVNGAEFTFEDHP